MEKAGSNPGYAALEEIPEPVSGDRPPWGDPDSWADVNQALADFIDNNRSALEFAFAAAEEVRQAFECLNPVWEELCSATCPDCRDICCTASRVWFEFRDLLLIHLLGLKVPPGQTRANLTEGCRYLTPQGCDRPRLNRPWRCSWYLCQAQVDLISARPPKAQRLVSGAIQRVLDNRQLMTDTFRAALKK